jgi:hypothetical protein
MEEKDIIEELKKNVPIDLLTEQQREEAKKFTYMLDSVKYIYDIIGDGLKTAKTYYDLYINNKEYGEF